MFIYWGVLILWCTYPSHSLPNDKLCPNSAIMADDWRTNAFRESIVRKIDEAIGLSGMNMSRNSVEMENHVFLKAKNGEEYLGFVARLILHVREMSKLCNQSTPVN